MLTLTICVSGTSDDNVNSPVKGNKGKGKELARKISVIRNMNEEFDVISYGTMHSILRSLLFNGGSDDCQILGKFTNVN